MSHVHRAPGHGLFWHRHPHKVTHRLDIDDAHPLPDARRDALRDWRGRPPSIAVTCSEKCASEGGH